MAIFQFIIGPTEKYIRNDYKTINSSTNHVLLITARTCWFDTDCVTATSGVLTQEIPVGDAHNWHQEYNDNDISFH